MSIFSLIKKLMNNLRLHRTLFVYKFTFRYQSIMSVVNIMYEQLYFNAFTLSYQRLFI